MKLIVTIDTEEDNWARYSTLDNPVENIKRLVILQQLFDRYKVKPTYLISYPVATNPESVAILKKFLDQGKCEIGTHCHPWNTPPFEEEINDISSMLCNLPELLIQRKLKSLHQAIIHAFGITPISFRAGRWGFNSTVAKVLLELGYLVDTSVTPFIDWRIYHGPDYSTIQPHPYRFAPEDIKSPQDVGALLEVPATVGYLQKNFERCQRFSRLLRGSISRKLHLSGLLHRLRLLNRVWLSPELTSANDMIQLARRMRDLNYPCLNMSFHSTILLAGSNPFVRNRADEVMAVAKIEKFLALATEEKWESVCLGEMRSIACSCSECFTPQRSDWHAVCQRCN